MNRPENLIYDPVKNTLKRKDGVYLEFVEECFKKGLKYMKFYNPITDKNIWYNYRFREYSKASKYNICTPLGKKLRMNRSIQVEGSFALLKETLKFRRLKIRGKMDVIREIGFLMMGYNFKIHIQKMKNKKYGNILHELKEA